MTSILCERADGVAVVTFNRPQRLNAFLHATYAELGDLLRELEADEAVRVVILTGSGRAFCAGEDLQELEEITARGVDMEELARTVERLQDITRAVVGSAKVYVAAVNGVAAGFGAELAVACDVRIGSESARLLFPEVRRGLFVTNGVTHLLPRLIGLGRAMELLVSGAAIDAREAERIGLVSRIVPDGEVLAAARALARTVAANESTSVRLTKRALREGVEGTLESALRRETEFALECARGGAHAEGARAFLEKRSPVFGRGGAP
jgi:enoyl-CoA hydratase/carnithine racemase